MNDEWVRATLGECYDLVTERHESRALKPEAAYFGLEHLSPEAPNARMGGKASDVAGQVTAFQRGDTLFGRLRPYLRKVSFAEIDGYCSPEILVLRPRLDQVEPRFLHLLASSDAVIEEAVTRSAGSRMPRTAAPDLAAIPIALPSLSIQRRIVDLITHVDNQLAALMRETLALSQLGVALAARGWEAAGSDGAVATLSASTSLVKNGVMYKRGQATGGVPVTRIETISTGSIDLAKVGYEGLTEANAANHLLAEGDILFSHKNSLDRVGTTALVTAKHLPLVNGDNLLQIRTADPEDAGALYLMLRSPQLRAMLRSITKPAVNQASVNTKQVLALPIPPLSGSKVRALAAAYLATESHVNAANEQRDALTQLRAVLLAALTAGTCAIPTSYDSVLEKAV